MSDPTSATAAGRPEVSGCLEASRRCREVVEHVRAADAAGELYLRIGPHLRHCVDHFRCLFRALEERDVVDYDARERDVAVERDPARCLREFEAVDAVLRALDPEALDLPLRVRQAAAPGGRVASAPSNLGRELVFLSGHTIHHLAVIRLVCESAGVAVPETLTTAYSTEAYRSGARAGSD